MNFLMKLRAIIGRITDILIAGREAGLWQEKNEPYRKSDRKGDSKENTKYEF